MMIASKKRIALLLSILMLCTCALASCGKKSGGGGDKYENETVIGSASEKPEVISALSEIITALTVDSIDMPCFSDMETAVSLCRDAVLNYLLTTKYSRFSGNTSVLQEAAKQYPNMNITSAIGGSDLEGELYDLFNRGGNIRQGDTERFKYLSKIEAYVPAVAPQACTYSLDIISVDETENTYRMTFYCMRGDEVSPEYLAVFVKRSSGDCYIKSLETTAGQKTSCALTPTIS